MQDDGIENEIANALRGGMMAASRIAEQLARVNENRLRHAEAASAQGQRELQNRFDAERLAARASLQPVGSSEWWDRASAKEVVDAWQTANAWRAHDPEAERAADLIRSQVRERYGVDADDPGARPEAVAAHLQGVVDNAHAADEHREQARRDEVEAARLLLDADRMLSDREAGLVDDVIADEAAEERLRDQAGSLRESAQLSRNEAERYDGIADSEARQAKQVADTGQALPASEATRPNTGKPSSRPRRPAAEPTREHTVSR